VARRKKGGLLYFEANLHHSFALRLLNGEKSIQRLQSNHVTSFFCLEICLDLFSRPSCLVQDVITKSKASYSQVDGVMVKVNGVDQPINLALSFAQDEITQIQGHW
jgi:hypothetical protein